MAMRLLMLLSFLLAGIILVPSGAHALEMPGKLAMDRATYFATQQLYLGWALFGAPIAAKILIDVTLGVILRKTHRAAAWAAWLSGGLVAVGLAVFFLRVQPANVATANWSTQPTSWQALRAQWEYGHLAIATLTALAFVATGAAAILAMRPAKAQAAPIASR